MKVKDDAALWFETQGQDIQDFEVPPEVNEHDAEADGDDLPADEMPYAEQEEEDERITQADISQRIHALEINRPTVEVIVSVMNAVVPAPGLALLKLDDDGAEDLDLTDEEHETLVKAWADYLGDKNVQVRPGTTLLMAIASIYGSNIYLALRNKKSRREIDILQRENERLREHNVRLQEEVDDSGNHIKHTEHES